MDSINDVLNAAKQYCREHTSEATYQYYCLLYTSDAADEL